MDKDIIIPLWCHPDFVVFAGCSLPAGIIAYLFFSCPVGFFFSRGKPHGHPLFLPCFFSLLFSAHSLPSIHKLYHLYFQNVVNLLAHPSLHRPVFLAQNPFHLPTQFRHLPSLVGVAVSCQPASCFSLSPLVCWWNLNQWSPTVSYCAPVRLRIKYECGRIGSASSVGFWNFTLCPLYTLELWSNLPKLTRRPCCSSFPHWTKFL